MAFNSEARVKRGLRFIRDKELVEKLDRNDLCPCGSGRRFQELLHGGRMLLTAAIEMNTSGKGWESRWLRQRVRKTRPQGSGSKPHQPTISPQRFVRSMAGHAPDKRGNLVRFQDEAPVWTGGLPGGAAAF